MTSVIYACCGPGRTTPPTGTDWGIFVLVAGVVGLWGLIGWHAVKEGWRRTSNKGSSPSVGPEAWGEPDLAPSTSPQALAEVAELEAMWRQPEQGRRADFD